MKKILRHHHVSFQHAFSGLRWALTTQPNFRIHLFLSAVALFLCWYLQVETWEWIVIIFTILLGLSSEMINTSLESMTDLITTEWRMQAKIAKDVAAGMMLLVAIGATIIGAFIFIPKIFGI